MDLELSSASSIPGNSAQPAPTGWQIYNDPPTDVDTINHADWQRAVKIPEHPSVYNFTKTEFYLQVNNQMSFHRQNLQPTDEVICGIRDQMARDVKTIQACIADESKVAFVCALVLQRQSCSGVAKVQKLVFTNQFQYFPGVEFNTDLSGFIKIVHKLGYHLVHTQQSHAEMSLLQFLHIYRSAFGSAPLAMVGNKGICHSCAQVLDLVWQRDCWLRKICPYSWRDDRMHYEKFYTPSVLMDFLQEADLAKFLQGELMPQYSDFWRTLASDYIGCTRKHQPVWRCRAEERHLCVRHSAKGVKLMDLDENQENHSCYPKRSFRGYQRFLLPKENHRVFD